MNESTLILEFSDPGVSELLEREDVFRTWEFIRRMGRIVTVEDITGAINLDRGVVHQQIDRMMGHGMLEKVRARKPRLTTGYRAVAEQIVVTFDEHDPKAMEKMIEIGKTHAEEFEQDMAAHADPAFHSKAGFRFRQNIALHLSKDELDELRRRVLAVVSFLNLPRNPPRGSQGLDPEGKPQYCNQAISIALDPLVGELLPMPTVITTPRSKVGQWDKSAAMAGGLGALSRREREIALAVTDGLSRQKIADQLGLSVNTISTLIRRAYRKIGVTSRVELAARLKGHDEPVPGDS